MANAQMLTADTYSNDPNVSVGGFDSLGIPWKYAGRPEAHRRDFLNYAGIISPVTYFMVRDLDAKHGGLTDRNGNFYGTSPEHAISRYVLQTENEPHGQQPESISRVEIKGPVVENKSQGIYVPLYAFARPDSRPEILSGIALQKLLAGGRARAVYDLLVDNYESRRGSFPEWLRVALQLPPHPSMVKAPPPAPTGPVFKQTEKGTPRMVNMSKEDFAKMSADLAAGRITPVGPATEGVRPSPVGEGLAAMSTSAPSPTAAPSNETVYSSALDFFRQNIAAKRFSTIAELMVANLAMVKRLSDTDRMALGLVENGRDSQMRLLTEVAPDGSRLRYLYDSNGNHVRSVWDNPPVQKPAPKSVIVQVTPKTVPVVTSQPVSSSEAPAPKSVIVQVTPKTVPVVTSQPVSSSETPAFVTSQPVSSSETPAFVTSQPVSSSEAPAFVTSQPVSTSTAIAAVQAIIDRNPKRSFWEIVRKQPALLTTLSLTEQASLQRYSNSKRNDPFSRK